MEYLRKSTISVRRTCKSLERKVTQVQNDFLFYKDQQEKQLNDFRQSLDYTSEQLETLQREKADLTRKVTGLKKDLEEQIDNVEQYSRRLRLVFNGIKEEREEYGSGYSGILQRQPWNNNLREPVGSLAQDGTSQN